MCKGEIKSFYILEDLLIAYFTFPANIVFGLDASLFKLVHPLSKEAPPKNFLYNKPQDQQSTENNLCGYKKFMYVKMATAYRQSEQLQAGFRWSTCI